MSATDWLILNVDDEQPIRYAKTRALQRAGFTVMEAASGTEGLECVEQYRPALVICDVKMPDMSGLEVSRTIKQRFPGTLVMQVSASFTTAQDRATGLEYGADTYLTEPLEPDELVASVRALLRLKEYENELQQAISQREFIFALAERQRELDDPQAIMDIAAEALGQRLHAQRAGFHEMKDADTRLVLSCWTGGELPPIEGEIAAGMVGENGIADYKAGRTIATGDLYEGREAPQGGRHASIGVPILRAGQWRASMFINAPAGREWSADEVGLAEQVAKLTWDAVERARVSRRLVSLNQSLEERVAERTRELLSTEAQLRQAQKMEAVGQLTGGIAHDFNNLLTGIIGGIRVVRRRIDQKRLDDIDAFMQEVTQSAERAAALVHRLLAFSRRQSLDFKDVDIAVLVEGLQDLLRRTVGEGIAFYTEMPAGLWGADTDSAQLETALLNLVINARDAMPDGGAVTIAAENFAAAAGAIEGLEPGEYVLIKVRDTGMGIPEDVIQRVFDPFFTTKPIGQGTGLGLSMVYGFMKQSQGHVEISSRPGQGTEVRLYLRRASGARDTARQSPQVSQPARHRGGTVLVVEDNHAVQMLVLDKLRELGYTALAASDGDEAVILLTSGRQIDLLITDVGLPGFNGRQVAEIAKESRPDIKIIFITGYAEAARVRSGFLPAGADFLTKPFEMDTLAAKVADILTR